MTLPPGQLVRAAAGRARDASRRALTADFHCVAGWSATNLHWEEVAFKTFYRLVIEPAVPPDAAVTRVTFGGLDGHRSVVLIEDAGRRTC